MTPLVSLTSLTISLSSTLLPSLTNPLSLTLLSSLTVLTALQYHKSQTIKIRQFGRHPWCTHGSLILRLFLRIP